MAYASLANWRIHRFAGQRGALDPVLRLRLRNVQCGDPQIPIVRKRDLDQSLQSWISQKIAPTDVDGRQRPVAGVTCG
jgi:hypothetical protein